MSHKMAAGGGLSPRNGAKDNVNMGTKKMARKPVSSSWLSHPKLYHTPPTLSRLCMKKGEGEGRGCGEQDHGLSTSARAWHHGTHK